MSADRLREMLSEATPAPWRFTQEDGLVRDAEDYHIFQVAGSPGHSQLAASARLAALAPDAIALLADMGEFVHRLAGMKGNPVRDELLQRLDDLCGDDR